MTLFLTNVLDTAFYFPELVFAPFSLEIVLEVKTSGLPHAVNLW